MASILLIDDDQEFSDELSRQLRLVGHDVRWLDLAEEGLHVLAKDGVDLVLLDNKMPRMSGLEFLAALRERGHGAAPVILMTSAHNDQTAIQATKMGAFGYVIKPINFEGMLALIEPDIKRALKIGQPVSPVPIPKAEDQKCGDDSVMIGRSREMLAVFQRIGEMEPDETVLILGETGTGKDLVAQAIHTNSPRVNRPFVPVNCAAISLNLLESELFGHEKGAFTGADKMRKGYFEHAHGGTLFLDEVGDMTPPLQTKLLRVLQNREIMRMGSSEPIEVDVRVLAATSHDLTALVNHGAFRRDLFFRLEGATIRIPPLRERQEDIEHLAKHFLKGMYGSGGPPPALHPGALQVLRNHPWPGNIRQLENVMRRARKAVRARRGGEIMPEDLDFGELDASAPAANTPPTEDSALRGLREAIAWAWTNDQPDLWPLLQEWLERELLRHATAQPGISQVQLARKLGMARNTLRARLKQYGLSMPEESGA